MLVLSEEKFGEISNDLVFLSEKLTRSMEKLESSVKYGGEISHPVLRI